MNQNLQDHRATGAYNAVVEFVAKMRPAESGCPIPDLDDQSEDDDDSHEDTRLESFPDLIKDALECFRFASGLLPYVTALCHSVGDDGILADTAEAVSAEYSQALGMALEPETLEDARIRLRDGGPVLGMLSRDNREYRYAVVKHLVDKRSGTAAGVEYSWRLHNAIREVKLLEADGLCLFTLYRLARELHFSTKQARRLTVGMIKKLTACNDAQAELLHEAYELLPLAPRG